MIECIKFINCERGYLQGFADFYIDKWEIEIRNCPLYLKDGKRWLNFPTKESKNEKGEKIYSPLIKFRKKDHMEAFAKEAKKSIDLYCEKAQKE